MITIPVKSKGGSRAEVLIGDHRIGAQGYLALLQHLLTLLNSTPTSYGKSRFIAWPALIHTELESRVPTSRVLFVVEMPREETFAAWTLVS